MRSLLLACAVLGLAPFAAGGDIPGDSTRAVLIVEADVADARVSVNDSVMGTAPLTVTLPGGRHTILVAHPDIANWLTSSVRDTIELSPGDFRRLRYSVAPALMLVSEPHDARVYIGDSLIGTTPLLVPPGHQITSITLKKQGYADHSPGPGDVARGVASVRLLRAWTHMDLSNSPLQGDGEFATGGPRLYVTGATTVLAGVAAAFFKIRADNRHADYLRTGDRRFLDQTHKLDTASAISLAAAQVSLALFTYFILSD